MSLVLSLLACSPPPELLTDAQLADAVVVAGEVEKPRLEATVAALVEVNGQEDGPELEKHGDKPHNHYLSAEYLLGAISGLTLDPVLEQTESYGFDILNVYVELPGSERPEEVILVTAHHDTWWVGADDNSSGVAVIMEAARILSARENKRTIRVVSFDQEETALAGARYHYEQRETEQIVGVVNLDSVAYTTSEPGSQVAPTGFTVPDVGDFIVALANGPAEGPAAWTVQLATAIPEPIKLVGVVGVGANDFAATGDFHRSDHSPAWFRDIPSVFFTDTTNFRNPYYHTEEDTPEKLDYDFLESVAQLTVGLTVAMDLQP